MATIRIPVNYNASELVRFFHSFPHYNLSFAEVSSKFAPTNQSYQEALLVILAVPIIWMLLWMVVYMVYFCVFCFGCRKRFEKQKKNSRPQRWITFFFALMAIMSVSSSIVGNELVNRDVGSADKSLEEIGHDVRIIKLQTATMRYVLETVLSETYPPLLDAYSKANQLNETMRPYLKDLVNQFAANMNFTAITIKDQVEVHFLNFNMSSLLRPVHQYEMWRRLGTHVLCGLVLLFMCFTMCAVGAKKRGFILLCVGVTVLNIIFVWAAVGFYMGIAVGMSDLCMDPSDYMSTMTKSGPSWQEAKLMRYYLDCDSLENPFSKNIDLMARQLNEANQTLSTMYEHSRPLGSWILQMISEPQKNLTNSIGQLEQLRALADCRTSHRSFIAAVNSICEGAIVGEVVVLAGLSLGGTFLIMLVFAGHMAAHFIASRRAYLEVDDQDIPAARDPQNRSENPLYYRFSQISTGENEARISQEPTAPPRNSPPPAYQAHGDFYSTYGNNGTLDSNGNRASNDLNRNSNTFR